MVRWLRITVFGGAILALIVVGGAVGLFLVENDRWEAVALHPWLSDIASSIRGGETREVWLWMPAVMAGWLVAVLLVAFAALWSLFYVWRRRQYESLITRLERELVALRNLPFTDPAPFEDIDERPSSEAMLSQPQDLQPADRAARERV